jgi:long-chain acyl-CoA synthetase
MLSTGGVVHLGHKFCFVCMEIHNVSENFSIINRMVQKITQMRPDSTAQIYKKDIYNRSISPELGQKSNSRNFCDITYSKLSDIISALSEGFSTLGVEKEDKIGIMSQTRIEWTWCDLCLLGNGVTVVPVYKTLKRPNIEYILNNADVQGIIIEGVEEIEKIQGVLESTDLEFIVSIDKIECIDKYNLNNTDFYTLYDVFQRGINSDPNLENYNSRIKNLGTNDLATIVHTSGTTGSMKGVKLSHKNIGSSIEQLDSICENAGIDLYKGQKNICFLPMSHIYARTADQFHPLTRCGSIVYAESVDTLMDDIKKVEPDLLYSVPRLYIRLNKKISEEVPNSILNVGRNTAEEWVEKDEKGIFLKAKYRIMDRILYSKIRSKFGTEFDAMVCAGGKIPEDLLKQLRGMAFPIVQGYGMTETMGGICVSSLRSNNFSSVGVPSKDTEVSIDSSAVDNGIGSELDGELGELLVKGPHITEGYYNDKSESEDSFTEDGYFRTGDILRRLEDGQLIYHDRKKLILVLDTGKNISPISIEKKFQEVNLIGNTMIVGDDKPFVSALIVPDFEYIQNKYEELEKRTKEDIVGTELIEEKITEEVDQINSSLEKHKKVRDFKIIDSDWTIENGYLTPSSKLCRRKIKEDFSKEISDMYE